ncbi:MAG TPA: hypothetical protein VHE61_23805 [Opitutaceae bacterium]|nr:hypothetical protein [Opitutaceae bacterium]
MRILKILLAAVLAVVALAAGVFVFAIAAAAILAFLLIRWIRHRVQGRTPDERVRPAPPGVIDVTATEVPPHELDRP